MSSLTSAFYKLSPKERLSYIKRLTGLSEEEAELLSSGALKLDLADKMIENVVGLMNVPMGIASGFIVNGREYLVPMATEQKGIISMASRGAELTRATGGFKAKSMGSMMIGQIQLTKVRNLNEAKRKALVNKERILQEANAQSRTRKAIDVEMKTLETSVGSMLIVELLVDVGESMGANVVDSMCEAVAPFLEHATRGKANLKIVSNLATKRLVCVNTVVSMNSVGGMEIVDRIVDASAFAEADPFRAATHNKGIMNGVSAVLMATNNDARAVEAGAHAYAAISGQYLPLSTWHKNEECCLEGKLVMPMAVGTVGGAISTHPTAGIALRILGVERASELGEVAASAGLAYNLAALKALVEEGVTENVRNESDLYEETEKG